jgi:hypothetical protein
MADRVVTAPSRPTPPVTARPTPPPPRPPAPSKPSTSPAPPTSSTRAQEVTTTFELLGAGLTLWSMMKGSQARGAYERAGDDKAKKNAAAKAVNSAQVMQLDAAALQIHAEGSGAAVAGIADQNEFVAALVDRLKFLNGVGGVAVSLLPLVYQVMANHAPPEARDNMPPELMSLGVLPPKMLLEKLEAQNKAKMARMQAEILREQKQAEDELREAQQSIQESRVNGASAA